MHRLQMQSGCGCHGVSGRIRLRRCQAPLFFGGLGLTTTRDTRCGAHREGFVSGWPEGVSGRRCLPVVRSRSRFRPQVESRPMLCNHVTQTALRGSGGSGDDTLEHDSPLHRPLYRRHDHLGNARQAPSMHAGVQRIRQRRPIARSLEHPNLVRLIGACTLGTPMRIVTELCEGGSLYELLYERCEVAGSAASLLLCHLACFTCRVPSAVRHHTELGRLRASTGLSSAELARIWADGGGAWKK